MTNLSAVISIYASKRDLIYSGLTKRKLLLENLHTLSNEIQTIDYKTQLFTRCNDILQQFEISLRTKIITEVETLVTEAIKQVLEINYLKFQINYSIKRNVVNVDFKILDLNSNLEYDIIESFGGGLADVVDITLHLVYLYHSGLRKVLILDERGKFISSDKQRNFGKFLNTISNELAIQIILISHKKEVIDFANKVIEVKKDKESKII